MIPAASSGVLAVAVKTTLVVYGSLLAAAVIMVGEARKSGTLKKGLTIACEPFIM